MKLLNLLILATTLILVARDASASSDPVPVLDPSDAEVDKRAELDRYTAEVARFRARFLAALPGLRVQQLYYIDPEASPDSVPVEELVAGYVVVSHMEVSGQQSGEEALKGSLRKIVESTPDYSALCFYPHHVVVLSDGQEQFYAVVCFDCSNYRLFSTTGDGIHESFDVSEEAVWDSVYAGAGLKRPPRDASQ